MFWHFGGSIVCYNLPGIAFDCAFKVLKRVYSFLNQYMLFTYLESSYSMYYTDEHSCEYSSCVCTECIYTLITTSPRITQIHICISKSWPPHSTGEAQSDGWWDAAAWMLPASWRWNTVHCNMLIVICTGKVHRQEKCEKRKCNGKFLNVTLHSVWTHL